MPNTGNGITVGLGADDAMLGSARGQSPLLVAANDMMGVRVQARRASLANVWVGMNKNGGSVVSSSSSSSSSSSDSANSGTGHGTGDATLEIHSYGGIVFDESSSDGSTIGGTDAASTVRVSSGAGDGVIIGGSNITVSYLTSGQCISADSAFEKECGNVGNGIAIPARSLGPSSTANGTSAVVIGGVGAVVVAGNSGAGIYCNRDGVIIQNVRVGEPVSANQARGGTGLSNSGHGIWLGAEATSVSIKASVIKNSAKYGVYVDGGQVRECIQPCHPLPPPTHTCYVHQRASRVSCRAVLQRCAPYECLL